MIGQIKVLTVNGRISPISDKLFELLSANSEIEAEISKILSDATVKTRKAGKKK